LPNAQSYLASRAFDYNGRIYFWLVFREDSTFSGGNYSKFRAQLQNSYYLYRDDSRLVAKAAAGNAGDVPTNGCLPQVSLTSGSTTFSWCGLRKTVVIIGANQLGYSTLRVPHDITFTFDSNNARRTARLGQTLYIPCGEGLLGYDGIRIADVGYHTYPWTFAVAEDATAGGLAAGTYAFKMTWRWENGRGEIDRSTTATVASMSASGAMSAAIAAYGPLAITHKLGAAAEVWRTAVNPTSESPFYLVTSTNPTSTSNPNRYLTASQSTAFRDGMSDSTASALQNDPENGVVLENIAAPPATIIAATSDRLFLAGIAGYPDQVWYSKTRTDGQVAAFNDALVFLVPPNGGDITAIVKHEGAIVVFRETATYAFAGDGFDNTGLGSNYSLARIVSNDLGAVSAEAVAVEERGIDVKTNKGWFVLDKGFTYQYIGAPVAAYDGEQVLAVHAMTARHQIRVVTTARVLTLDTLVNQWSRWTIGDGLGAAIWNGTYAYLASTGPKLEQASYAGLDYGMDIETAWIKLSDLQGRGYVRTFQVLGEYRSSHSMRVRCARDYLSDGAGGWLYYDDVTWPVTPAVVGGPEQLRHGPSQKRCQAIKVRLTVTSATDEAVRLSGLALDVGVEPGLYQGLSTGQRA
jgi:hypothetical protein